jgi:hypothetical protein
LGTRLADRRPWPAAAKTLENDQDYAAIQSASPGLRSVRARMWRQMMVSPGGHGNLKAWPALIWAILVAGLAIALWRGASR